MSAKDLHNYLLCTTISIIAGVRIEVGFQKTGYAVSESDGSVAIVVVVNGNLTTPFDVQITGTNGTASCE